LERGKQGIVILLLDILGLIIYIHHFTAVFSATLYRFTVQPFCRPTTISAIRHTLYAINFVILSKKFVLICVYSWLQKFSHFAHFNSLTQVVFF